MPDLLTAASFVDQQTFDALVAGFAAFAAVVSFYSAFAALLSWLQGEEPADTANAAAVGLAYGCPVGLYVAFFAVRDAITMIH